MLCAQKRGDIAGTLFADAIKSEDDDRVQELFLVLGDAITMAAAFVGLPHTMPANFGLIAQLKQRNILQVATKPR